MFVVVHFTFKTEGFCIVLKTLVRYFVTFMDYVPGVHVCILVPMQ